MYETKTELLENFKTIPVDQQNKIIHIRDWTQKCPKNFYPKKSYNLESNCFVCTSINELQPHHLTYVPVEEFLTVCNGCHSFVHEKHIRYKVTIEERKIHALFLERFNNPTVEDKEYQFKHTHRCKWGKCSECNRVCLLRKRKIEAIKFRIEENRWRWTNANR